MSTTYTNTVTQIPRSELTWSWGKLMVVPVFTTFLRKRLGVICDVCVYVCVFGRRETKEAVRVGHHPPHPYG